jgi:hypothetical protein
MSLSDTSIFVRFLLDKSLASEYYMPTFRVKLCRINTPKFSILTILHTYPPIKMEQSVPKRRHIKFRPVELPRRQHATLRTWRKFEMKKNDVDSGVGLGNI